MKEKWMKLWRKNVLNEEMCYFSVNLFEGGGYDTLGCIKERIGMKLL